MKSRKLFPCYSLVTAQLWNYSSKSPAVILCVPGTELLMWTPLQSLNLIWTKTFLCSCTWCCHSPDWFCMLLGKAHHLDFSKLRSQEGVSAALFFDCAVSQRNSSHSSPSPEAFQHEVKLKKKKKKNVINQKFSHRVSKVNYKRIGNSKSVINFLSYLCLFIVEYQSTMQAKRSTV